MKIVNSDIAQNIFLIFLRFNINVCNPYYSWKNERVIAY